MTEQQSLFVLTKTTNLQIWGLGGGGGGGEVIEGKSVLAGRIVRPDLCRLMYSMYREEIVASASSQRLTPLFLAKFEKVNFPENFTFNEAQDKLKTRFKA